MIITIDGPAGTGKSTVALTVAQRLGFDFLDTGAMYRAIALEVLRRETDMDNARELEFVARMVRIDFDWSVFPPRILLNGESVGPFLRSGECTRAASRVAVVPAIREMMVKQQRDLSVDRGNIVTEGRDQGSVVFPAAELKIFLDADARERAHRRVVQLRARGEVADFNEILSDIVSRDKRDASRATGPMTVPQGAFFLNTTSLSEEEVVNRIIEKSREVMQLEPVKNA